MHPSGTYLDQRETQGKQAAVSQVNSSRMIEHQHLQHAFIG